VCPCAIKTPGVLSSPPLKSKQRRAKGGLQVGEWEGGIPGSPCPMGADSAAALFFSTCPIPRRHRGAPTRGWNGGPLHVRCLKTKIYCLSPARGAAGGQVGRISADPNVLPRLQTSDAVAISHHAYALSYTHAYGQGTLQTMALPGTPGARR